MSPPNAHPRDDDIQGPYLYHAEQRFQGQSAAAEMRFDSAKEAQRWIADLFGSETFAQSFPGASGPLAADPPRVRTSRNKRKVGTYNSRDNEIILSTNQAGVGMTLPTVLHEAAHVVDDHTNELAPLQAAHSQSFAAAYLDLVALSLGDEEAARLERDFESGEVEIGERHVTNAGVGMIRSGKISAPSEVRNAETVAADKAKRLTREADKHWERWTAAYGPTQQVLMVRSNRRYFEAVRAAGGTIPHPVEVVLAAGDEPVPIRTLAVARRLGNQPSPRCGKWMPRAKVPCGKAAGHSGSCGRR